MGDVGAMLGACWKHGGAGVGTYMLPCWGQVVECFGAGVLRCKVLLQVRVVCEVWTWHASAAGVPLQAVVRALCALWSWLAGLQGAGAGYYCQRAVCILGTGVLLQHTAVRVRCAL